MRYDCNLNDITIHLYLLKIHYQLFIKSIILYPSIFASYIMGIDIYVYHHLSVYLSISLFLFLDNTWTLVCVYEHGDSRKLGRYYPLWTEQHSLDEGSACITLVAVHPVVVVVLIWSIALHRLSRTHHSDDELWMSWASAGIENEEALTAGCALWRCRSGCIVYLSIYIHSKMIW